MELLKPCPRCGQPPIAGPAAVGTGIQLWTIVCPRCGEQTESCATIEVAAELWNRDPPAGEGDEDPTLGEGLGESLAVPA